MRQSVTVAAKLLVSGAGSKLTTTGDVNIGPLTGVTVSNTFIVTQADGGAMQVGGAINVGGSTAARIGVLGGSGTINGSVNVAVGVLAPGDSPGTLTITGDLTLASSSHLSMQFGRADVVGGPLNDLVKVGGNLTLDGALDVAAADGGAFDPGLYRIISYDGAMTGPGLTLGSAPAGSQLAIQTSIAGQVNLVNYTGVPVNFWDGTGAAGDNVVQGGAGVWTVAGTNWTLPNGALNAAYDTTALAVFAAAPGAVTVSGPVSAAGMQFAVDGYANTAQGFAQAGYRLTVGKASVEPFAEAAYVAVHADGFTEHGGVDYGDVTPASTVRFGAGGWPFSVEGAPLARDAGVVEVGLDMRNDNAVFGLTYGAQGATHDFDQTVRVDLRLAF